MNAALRGRYSRGSTRVQRGEQEKRALRDAACAALLELPEHAITVAELCQRAGVGRNTLYLHWPSCAALLTDGVQQAEQRLRSALVLDAEQRRTPRSQLAALGSSWLQFLTDQPQLGGLFFSSAQGRLAVDRVLSYELSQLGRHAYAAGLSSRVPSEEVLSAVSGAFQALGERVVRGRVAMDLNELAGILTQLTLGALR